ncbi:glycohydrolase toxin TNT-related protein [Asticcacaulis solisilvae]|uniref:glycohydrolase toxin TNT-related protein n=1 Tax=Asticcacaulis solisilvae TaxID=1217274 RepID=UPI003FD8022D
MVAIVTGSGQGLVKSSLAVLGSQGEIGTSKLGQNGSDVIVNAANGNLLIQSQDEMLFGLGLDDAITNTYNSKAAAWQENYQRHVTDLTGFHNKPASTITRYGADGSAVVYTYNSSSACYVGVESGITDTITYDATAGQWTWQDGKTRAKEVYEGATTGRILQSTDASGNTLTYTYSGSQLAKITTANGDYTSFVYTGSLLTSIVTSYTNASGLQTETRVRYGYDTSNRLTTVTTDLSPNDNSVSDGKTYVTTYTYLGTSNNIGTITESDGTSLTITYDSNVRVASLTQTTASGVTSATYLTYGTGRTTVTDQQGNATTLVYDSNNQLIQLIPPSSSPQPPTQFIYDTNGNVTYSGPVGDPNFTNIAQNWGNLGETSGVGTTQTTEMDGGVFVYRRQTTTTPAAGFQFNMAQTAPSQMAVVPGQAVQLSVYAASSGASRLELRAMWYNSAGTYIGSTGVSTVAPGGTLGANGLTTANFAGGSVNAIANAAFVSLAIVATANGTGPLNVAIARPSVATSGGAGDSQFTNIAQNWNELWNTSGSVATTQATEVDGGVNVYRRQTTTTPPTGWQMNLGQGANGRTAVIPGHPVTLSAYVSSVGASALGLYAAWYSSSGTLITSTLVSSVATNGSFGSAGVTAASYGSGTVLPPPGAASVELLVQATASGTAPLNVGLAQPSVSFGSAGGDTAFTNIAQNWGGLWTTDNTVSTTQTTETDGGTNAYRRQTTSTPAAGWLMNLQQTGGGLMPVTPGQTVSGSVYAASSGASTVSLVLSWFDAYGNYIGGVGSAITPGGVLGSSGITTANYGSVSGTAPAGAVYAGLIVQGAASGTGPMNVAIAQPSISTLPTMSSSPAPSYLYTYDANGNRLSMTDSLGNQTTYAYDAANQLLMKTEAANSSSPLVTRYVYDSASRLVYTISPRGDVTRYIYNTSNGLQTSVIKYTANLYLIAGNQSSATMDSWASSAGVDKTQTQRTDTTYDARGLVATVTTYGQTDSSGNGVSSTASTTTYVYDQAGLLLSRKLSSSSATETYVYDGLGRTLSATDYNGKLTQTVYTNTASGLQTAVTLANGTVRTSAYDKAGELISVTDSASGLSATTTYTYDSVGNLIRTTDPTGLSTYHVFDTLNRKVADVAADGAIVTYAYNAADQLVSTTQYATLVSAAQLTLLANESASSAPVRLPSITPAASASDRWSWSVYDADGRLAEQIDAWGAVTAYSYDAAGRLITTTAYAGVLSAATVAAFKTTAPTAVILPGADANADRTTRTFYNADDQVIGTLDADGYLTQIIYDAAGRKTQTIAYATQTNSAHWVSGTFAQLLSDAGTNANDINHWWVYDGRGLLRADIDGEGNITRYDSYTAAGNAGTVIKGQVISTAALIATPPIYANLPAPSGTLEITSYTYDQYGHVLTKAQTLTGGAVETTTYGYDAVYNLYSQAVASSSSASGGADGRTDLIRYDSLGRKGAELTGNGAAAIAALGSNPTQAQIDAVWAAGHISYAYDAAGRLIMQTDAESRRTLFYYDVDGRLTYQIDGTGGVTRYTHNAFGEETDVTTYTNKIAAGTLATLTGGQITSTLTNAITLSATDSYSHVDYSTNGVVADTVDALGNITGYAYNAFREVTSRIDALTTALATQTNKTYSRRGLLLTSTADVGGLALATSYQYDAFGRTTQVTDPKGNIAKTTYDRAGRVLTQVDGLNLTTSYSYDGFGHVLTTTDGTGAVTHYAFNLFDRQITVTDPNGIVTTTTKNAYGQTVKIVDGMGVATTFDYDADGNVIKTTDGAGNVVTHSYSKADMMTATADARGGTTSYVYDAAGRMYSQTVDPGDGLNLTTTWVFDGKGQTLTVTDPTGMVTAYTYDLDGHTLSQRVDANGLNLTTSWTYDQAGRAVTETSPAGRVVKSVYDKANRVIQSIVDPSGLNLITQYSYDGDGNVVQVTDPGGHITRSTYDADNRLAFVIDATGAVTGYTYDNDGRVNRTVRYATVNLSTGVQTLAQMQSWASANAAAGDLTNWTGYDVAGRLVYAIDPDGYVTGYAYDADNRLVQQVVYPTSVVFPNLPSTPPAGSSVTRYTYDAAGNKAFVIDPNGAVTAYTYDGNGNVTQTVRYAALNSSTNAQTLSQMQTWVTANAGTGSRTTSNLYDAANRLVTTTDAAGFMTGYNYDADGRVVREIRYPLGAQDLTNALVTNIAYDAAGRKTFVTDPTGAVTAYTYDLDGNVLTTVQYAVLNTNKGVQTLTDMRNWLSANSNAIANDSNNRTTYATYDNAGRLTSSKDALGYQSVYQYDNAGNLLQMTQYATLTNTQPRTTQYTYDADNRVINVTDPLGIVTHNIYDIWGRVTSRTVAYGTSDAQETTYLYDADGRVLRQMITGAAAIWHVYDAQGRIVTNYDQASSTTTYTYDNDGRVLTTTDPTGAVTTNTYNAFGDLTSVRDPNGNTGYFYYDARGQQILAVDALGYATGKSYDINGKVTVVTRYATAVSGAGISANPPAVTTNANDNTTSFGYDNDGRVLASVDGNGAGTTYTYNAFGDRLTMRNAAGGVTTYTYNARGEMLTQTVAATAVAPAATTAYAYDAFGNRTQMVEAQGRAEQRTTNYVYDADNRLVQQSGDTITVGSDYGANLFPPVIPTQSFAYDRRGNQIAAQDADGNITLTYYDVQNRKTAQVNAQGILTQWTYDWNGNVTSQKVYSDPLQLPTFSNGVLAQIYRMYDIGLRRLPVASEVSYWQGVLAANAAADQPAGQNWQRDAQGHPVDPDGEQLGALEATYASFIGDATVAANLQVNGTTTAFITAAYQGAFRRNPTSDEITFWTNNLAGNWTKAGVVMYLAEWQDHKTLVNSLTLSAIAGTTAPSPVNASNYRETDYTYDKDNRQTSTSIVGVETGAWNGSAWASQTGNLTTSTVYDLNGNAIRQTDANGNNTYTWYDKLGRKVAQIDAGGFMTAWTLDAEGNTTQQVQYATALSGPFTAGGNPPAAPAANGNDRTTTYTYDHDGQRLTETRKTAAYSTVSGNSVTSTSGDVTVTYTYNSLGLVATKTEATGDQTTYSYDALGRLATVTTAANVPAAANATAYTYDGLGNILTTVAGSGTSGAETTTFVYGAGGRLATKTDATGFVTTYGYDANGQKTIEQYTRAKSDGTTVTESKQYGYDGVGQQIFEGEATLTGGQWIFTQTVDSWYDAYGEVVQRGVNTNRNGAKAQEFADYDAAGRVWRSNMGDGVTKAYGYDKNGNVTLQVQSQGTTDLRNAASLDAARGASGITTTYSLYDSRNELTDVKRPVSANLDGTVASGGNVVVGGKGFAKIDSSWTVANWNQNTDPNVTVSFTSSDLSTIQNGYPVIVSVTGDGTVTQESHAIPSGATSYTFSPTIANGSNPNTPPRNAYVVIQLAQAGVVIGQAAFYVSIDPGKSGSSSTQIPMGKAMQVSVPNASAVTLYARTAGSSGGYTAVTATQMVDANNAPIPGSFVIDLTKPPFNGTASTSWDVKYLATDASGKVVDAKAGSVTFDNGSPPNPTSTSFATVPVFTATQSGGVWTLANSAIPAVAYSDSTQAYNAFGDITSQTDANGNTTGFTYDALGNLTQKTGAQVTVVGENGVGALANPVDTYYYDKSGRQIGHRDANGYLTTQTLQAGTGYDGTASLATAQYNPDGGVVSTTYDVFGNALTVTDATGAKTTNTYDKDNRLTTVAHAIRGGSQLVDSYGYDGLGERIKHWNNVQSGTETTDYDVLGRVTKSAIFGGTSATGYVQTTTYGYSWNVMTAGGRVTVGQAGIGSWTTTTAAFGHSSASTTDYFGKVVSSTDFGGHTTSYSYDLNGQLTLQTSTAGQYLAYTYTTSGQVGSITDTGTGIKSVYAYDKNGNRTIEGYYRIGSTPGDYQNSYITYDALNRVSEIRDPNADITYAYDAVGNRREIKTKYTNFDRVGVATYAPGSSMTGLQDYWYKYDSMNRFTVTMGTLSGGVISAGSTGVTITYNARGDRMSASYGQDGHIETYAYTTDDYLQTVYTQRAGGSNYLTVSRTVDVLGRMTSYAEYNPVDGSVIETRAMTYGLNDGRITSESDITTSVNALGTTSRYFSTITNTYTSGGTDIGVLTQSATAQSSQVNNGSITAGTTTTTTYNYVWWNQAKSSTTTISNSDPNSGAGNASYIYDVNGNQSEADDTAIHRVMKYQTDSFGQVLTRKESVNGIAGAYRTFFYLNGHVVGDVGTDQLASQVDYAQQLARDASNAYNAGSALYSTNATQVVPFNANFDENYQAYNSTNVAQSASGYTVMAGDTLQSIAQNVWGDSSLWYLLAQANGLSAGTALSAGQSLIVPDNVTNLHNASSVFKPYNSADALGNTTPTLPQQPQPPAPKHGGCGVIGDIIATIVSIVVRAATSWMPPQISSALSDAARQGVEMLAGNQKKFNWAELGAAFVAGYIEGQVGLEDGAAKPWTTATQGWDAWAQGAASSAIQQSTNIAFGVQKKFDWTQLASASVSASVGKGMGEWENGNVLGGAAGDLGHVLTGAAVLLAGAATRTVLTHDSFGKSLKTMLPDAIGSTIGHMIADGMQQSQAEQSAKSAAAKAAAQKQQAQEQIDAALNDNGLSAVKFGALDKEALRAQHILSGSYSGSVRDDGTFYQDTYPQVKQGDQMVPQEGAEDKGGQLFRFDDGAKAEGRQVTVEWAARDDGSAGVYVVSVDGGQFHEFNRDSRIDALGLSISYGADTYDFKAAAARYEVRKAEAETYNDAMRHSSDYAAIGNPDAAAYWAYRARAGEAAAGAAQWSGFWKQARNDGRDMGELLINKGLQFSAGPIGMFVPDLVHFKHETIRPEERTGASTFTALSIATSIVTPEMALPKMVSLGSKLNAARNLLETAETLEAADKVAAAESAEVNAAKSVAPPNEIVWPPNRGFLGDPVPQTLDVGYRFDRYGGFFDKTTGEFKDLGTFVAKEGTPYPARALPPGSDAKPFSTYEVLKPIPDVPTGPSAPWFNQPGLGIQHELPMPIQDLVEQGYIRRVDQVVPAPKF